MPRKRISLKAVASFVLGLLTLAASFLAAIPALILASLALRDLRRQPVALKGKRLALTGALLACLLSPALIFFPILAVLGTFDGSKSATSTASVSPPPPPPEVPAGARLLLAGAGAEWRWLHLADGSDPALTEAGFHRHFAAPGYDDSDWQRATDGGLGFGYGDPVSVDIVRPPDGARHSAYFRIPFATREPFTGLLLLLVRDDGVIVYLDGDEVARSNVPDGAPEEHALTAKTTIGGDWETTPAGLRISRPLPPGDHVLAISLHNAETTSSDLRLANVKLYGLPGSEDE